MLEWDLELFRWVQLNLRREWLDPVVRVFADTGLGQVQLIALLAVLVRRKWTRATVWVPAVLILTVLASLPALEGYGVLTFVAGLLALAVTWGWSAGLAKQALLAGLMAGAIRLPFANAIGRWRPSNLDYAPPLEALFYKTSFPSGHATTTAAIATVAILAMARTPKAGFAWAAFAWFAWVGFSRVYSGVHFPLDVMAGGALGAMVGSVVWWLTRKWDADQPVTTSSP